MSGKYNNKLLWHIRNFIKLKKYEQGNFNRCSYFSLHNERHADALKHVPADLYNSQTSTLPPLYNERPNWMACIGFFENSMTAVPEAMNSRIWSSRRSFSERSTSIGMTVNSVS
jgi:hypothetical protein